MVIVYLKLSDALTDKELSKIGGIRKENNLGNDLKVFPHLTFSFMVFGFKHLLVQ